MLARLGAVADCRVHETGPDSSLGAMAERVLATAPATFALAGHSMGGRVALEIMRRAPQRVERIALLDTGWRALPAGSAGEDERAARYALLAIAREQGMRAMGRVWVQRMVHPARLADDGLMDAILDMIERQTPDQFAAQIEALLARPDAGAVLRAIRCPTLVLCGRQDAWSPLAQHEEMAAMIPGASARGRSTIAGTWRRWSGPSGWPTRCCDWLRAPAADPREGAPMGELSVRVQAVRDEALDVRSFVLVPADARPLPAFAAGSHIDVHVAPGLVRQYSLCNDPAETGRYQIAVKREPASRGGSQGMHERVREGDLLTISAPRNNFALSPAARHHLLIAGGIGITPLLGMARQLARAGAEFALVYFSRSIAHTAFHELLSAPEYRGRVTFHYALEPEQVRAYLRKLLWTRPPDGPPLSVRAAPVHGPGRGDGRADVAAGCRASRVLLGGSGVARGAEGKASSSSSRATAASSRSPRAGRSSKCSRSTA